MGVLGDLGHTEIVGSVRNAAVWGDRATLCSVSANESAASDRFRVILIVVPPETTEIRHKAASLVFKGIRINAYMNAYLLKRCS